MIRYQMRSLLGTEMFDQCKSVCGPCERISALKVGVAIER